MRRRSSSAGASSRRPTRCASAGFTLVEVLVALTATVLVAGAVYFAFSTALASAERNRAAQEAARSQRNARMVLTALLRSARADVMTDDGRFRGVDAAHAPSGSDELRLVGALGFPFARYSAGEPLRVRLWLGVTPEGEGVAAARALLVELAPWGGRGRDPGADTVVLFPALDGTEITYRDPSSGVWLSDWDRPGLLPGAVAIEFQSAPPERPVPAMVVNLPVRRAH